VTGHVFRRLPAPEVEVGDVLVFGRSNADVQLERVERIVEHADGARTFWHRPTDAPRGRACLGSRRTPSQVVRFWRPVDNA
jgi:hypothetical protein